MSWILAFVVVAFVAGFAFLLLILKSRNMHIWIIPYIVNYRKRKPKSAHELTNVYFCIADHFEPYWGGADRAVAHDRVVRWCKLYREVSQRHLDSNGRPPVYSYFYPIEEYDEEIFTMLGDEINAGRGDMELHLHHDNDTADNLRKTIADFLHLVHQRHGFFRLSPETGGYEYAFIHGNWALDNSRPDGRWCGVDNELSVLRETGCYMDMTMPSAPSDTQTRIINSIYFASGKEGCRKSHDSGREARVGAWSTDSREILFVQGPLLLNWQDRKWGLIPKIENGELSGDNPPTPSRVRLWGKARVAVRGDHGNIFIKVHTHGVNDQNLPMFEQGGLDNLFTYLESEYSRANGFNLHYVSAREMYERIKFICLDSGIS